MFRIRIYPLSSMSYFRDSFDPTELLSWAVRTADQSDVFVLSQDRIIKNTGRISEITAEETA